jgi:hypothetical protein
MCRGANYGGDTRRLHFHLDLQGLGIALRNARSGLQFGYFGLEHSRYLWALREGEGKVVSIVEFVEELHELVFVFSWQETWIALAGEKRNIHSLGHWFGKHLRIHDRHLRRLSIISLSHDVRQARTISIPGPCR